MDFTPSLNVDQPLHDVAAEIPGGEMGVEIGPVEVEPPPPEPPDKPNPCPRQSAERNDSLGI